jgi:hypothetical protein
MKNQYFGDINDYRKYGLLRVLTKRGQLGTGIFWMLTEPDSRKDGARTDYLTKPLKWRQYDPDLWDALWSIVHDGRCRDVAQADSPSILKGMRFFPSVITDNHEQRKILFQEAMNWFKDLDLIFFDPDNGIKVRSTPPGRKGSSKYVYWHELKSAFHAGSSLLIYQHFPRVKKIPYIEQRTRELVEHLQLTEVHAYQTSHVVFFLVPQPKHIEYFRVQLKDVNLKWEGQIHGTVFQGV